MLRAFLCGLVFVASVGAQTPGYVVLAAFAATDPFDAASRVLAEHHRAEIVRFDPADLEPVRAALTKADPRHVVLVMRPEQIEFAFQRRFLQLATAIDGDPFADFAFGYVTGRTAEDAVALARRGVARKPRAAEAGVAIVSGGNDQSVANRARHALRKSSLPALHIHCAGQKAFAEAGRDREFLQKHLPKLKGCDAVTFVGHGYPREVVGGPTFAELAGLELEGAVVLNVACYTGVTNRWFEDDWRRAVVQAREVPLDESFCLALLRTGVVGYTAYLCPRPAGPELDTDLAALVADGLSLGDARRRDYDKTVLGFLGFGEERMQLGPVADGASFSPNREAVRDIMLEGATGGVLFGDPACVPFVARKDDAPVELATETKADAIVVKARAAANAMYLHCSDPTAEWGKTMAMRVYARLPLGDRHVTDVVVDELKIGKEPQPSRVLWAVEVDHGERFVHLKVDFPRPEKFVMAAMRLSARVLTTADGKLGKERGGEVQRRAVASKDVRSRVLEPFLLERATAREVSREVMQEALDASAELFAGVAITDAKFAALRARGSEGFRAVCAMLDVGHSHWRTWELLEATWRPGDERHLLALAGGPDLPNYAMWSVLQGLGAADTAEVRTYLRKRLADEQDAGLYMSIAAGLAHMGAREAIGEIGARVREFREDWSGVQPHLLRSLAEFGGAEAAKELEAIGCDKGCKDVKALLAVLDRLDAEAAGRVRAARGVR
ncbi:MAG TPA: hypothetical protein VF384_06920 [Planctomycetota bacterium]